MPDMEQKIQKESDSDRSITPEGLQLNQTPAS